MNAASSAKTTVSQAKRTLMNMVNIGKVEINGRLALAPMAGVSDVSFRELCRALGAAYSTTEMVSAKALVYKDQKTRSLLQLGEGEHPAAAQIFGSEPEVMRRKDREMTDRAEMDDVLRAGKVMRLALADGDMAIRFHPPPHWRSGWSPCGQPRR